MHRNHRTPKSRSTTSWWLVLAIVFGAFMPGWHALADRGSTLDPSRELCSAYGVVIANPGEPAPASGPETGKSHCSVCPIQLLAALLPADAPSARQGLAPQPMPRLPDHVAPTSAPQRWTAPRGPPAQG